ncbi:hypothetical protein KZS87_001894 [Campylobacter jejuni]|nr:hypothetical protein [Campylobacter jejuni]
MKLYIILTFLKDDESIDIYYPPNFYEDTSIFNIVEPRFFNSREYYKNYKLLIVLI